MRWVLTALVVSSLVAGVASLRAADDAKKDAIKEEIKKLQGTWAMVSGESDGEKLTPEKVKQIPKVVLVFADEGLSFRKYARGPDAPPQVVLKGDFKIDPSQKLKTIDITITGDINEDKDKGKIQLGIYELDGDSLKVCVAEPGDKGRPKEFSTKAGTRHMLFVLKREKR
jgi:uncharacterized protein (TIGR03067 family)